MNVNMTVGQAACRLYSNVVILKSRWLRPAFGESCRFVWIRLKTL